MTDIVRDMNSRDVDRPAAHADSWNRFDDLYLSRRIRRGRSLTASIAAARGRGSDRRCKVTGAFDAGEVFGLMCQVEVGDGAEPAIFVSPIAELAFDRSIESRALSPIIAAAARRRASATRNSEPRDGWGAKRVTRPSSAEPRDFRRCERPRIPRKPDALVVRGEWPGHGASSAFPRAKEEL